MAKTISMSWKRLHDGRVVITKGGVHMTLTDEELNDLRLVIHDIQWDEQHYYKKDNRHNG